LPEPLIQPIRGRAPQLHAESWVAPNASVIGQVTLAARASVWYGATLRAETEPIEIGFGTNIQDGVTIHVDAEFPVSVGAGVSVGHNAVLHGCVIEDDALIGMGAVILNGARIGEGSLIAASALVPQGIVVPPRSLVTGVPGSVRRELSDAEIAKQPAQHAGVSAAHRTTPRRRQLGVAALYYQILTSTRSLRLVAMLRILAR